MSNKFEQFRPKNEERASESSSNHMMGEVVNSGFHCHHSDSASKNNSASDHLPSVSIGAGGNGASETSATKSGDASTGSASSNSSAGTEVSYNPANDAALQNLSNTGDAQLKSDLLKAYGDVQSGQLSQSAYNQFENAAIPLTDPNSEASHGMTWQTDQPLEQYALNSISKNMSSADANSLQQIIGGQNSDTTGGSSGTASGGDASSGTSGTASGGDGGNGSSGGTAESSYNPANDAALQNLPGTGDAQLQQALVQAYSDVQSGQLSQDGYNKFENAAIPLTDPTSDASKGLSFSTDIPLEQYALTGIGSQISSSDTNTLQGVINGQKGDSTGGSTGSTSNGGSTGSTSGNGSGSDNGNGSGSGTTSNGGDSGVAPTSVSTIINQNTQSDNTVFPGGGVQADGYGWAKGATGGWPSATRPDAANSSVTWMDIYPENGSAETQGAQFDVKDLNEYALMKSGQWVKVSSSDTGGAWAQNNPNNMQGITGSPAVNYNSDGSFSVAAASDGNVDQIGGPGGSFDPSQIVGIYDSAQIKSNVDDPNAVAQLGADWYNGGQYIQQIGSSNWIHVTNQYQSVSMTNIDAATLADNPPPGATG